MSTDIRFTLGPVLGGAFLSTALYGSLFLQLWFYLKQYPNDPKRMKAVVLIVCLLDTIQTCCIVSLSFQYLIFNFGRPEIADHVFQTVTISLLLTALLTFTVNSFLVHKIHRLSQGNWWISSLTVFSMVSRLGVATVTVIELLRLQSFHLYGHRYGALLTTGLSLSVLTDLLVTGGLCYYLRTLNPELYGTRKMLSIVVKFADHTGALTCIVALSSLVCWIVIPSKLFYLAFHFLIGKCYSNCLLATLNMRNYVNRTATTQHNIIDVVNPSSMRRRPSYFLRTQVSQIPSQPSQPEFDLYNERVESPVTVPPLEIKVNRIVQHD